MKSKNSHLPSVAVLIAFFLQCAQGKEVPGWGCYDPKPGHITELSKSDFLIKVSDLAVKAERIYGAPAAALIAMMIVESGYGGTRTALNADNLFGWKYYSKESAEGRDYYVLTCQDTTKDPNNKYVKFSSYHDCVMFVAKRMSKMDLYRGAFRDYRMNCDSDTINAVNSWVDAIADAGYNWKPEEYKKSLKNLMRNVDSPSSEFSDASNLYHYSRPLFRMSAALVDSKIRAARYMHSGKGKVVEVEGWENFPTIRYRYSVKGYKDKSWKQAEVILLDPTATQMTDWIFSACLSATKTVKEANVMILINQIVRQSGAQFPVSGVVYEDIIPSDGIQEAYCFRDGVTVKVEGFRHRNTAVLKDSDIKLSFEGKIEPWTGRFARIASTTREHYKNNGGEIEVGSEDNRLTKWLTVVRGLYKEAWRSRENKLINAWAHDALK